MYEIRHAWINLMHNSRHSMVNFYFIGIANESFQQIEHSVTYTSMRYIYEMLVVTIILSWWCWFLVRYRTNRIQCSLHRSYRNRVYIADTQECLFMMEGPITCPIGLTRLARLQKKTQACTSTKLIMCSGLCWMTAGTCTRADNINRHCRPTRPPDTITDPMVFIWPLRYVVYFRFSGWRHISIQWTYASMYGGMSISLQRKTWLRRSEQANALAASYYLRSVLMTVGKR